MFTFPLRHGDERLGALDLYRDVPGPFNAKAMVAAQTLADVAAAYMLNAQARSDLVEASHRSAARALRDALTGLPNRTALLEHLDRAVRRSKRSGRTTAVLFTDLDRLKGVNDRHGHGVGDELLVAVAARLVATKRAEDTLARLYGDEFAMVCEGIEDRAEADQIAQRIRRAIAQPFELSSTTLSITASVGVALTDTTDQSPQQLLDRSDAAMYVAKRRGGAQVQVGHSNGSSANEGLHPGR